MSHSVELVRNIERGTTTFLTFWLLAISVTGCGLTTTVNSDGTTVRHYFGYTRIEIPVHKSTEGNFSVMEISSTGARFWPSVGFGYFHERNEYIPLDSRIVVKVQNQQQLDQVIEILAPIAKEGLSAYFAAIQMSNQPSYCALKRSFFSKSYNVTSSPE